ncbi:HWE histidine kinase domain-containing protein [Sulfitobacter sp. LCG007]
MLTLQDPDPNPLSFLVGNGEMAQRIRAFDWSMHPFGPPESWPQALRSALGICLNSAFPTAIYWGPELRLLYNDAWSFIPGPRHPDCLGQRASDVWADIFHIIEPQFSQIIRSGEGLFVEDQHLPMKRFGYTEQTYWSYSFTPIRGADGRIQGVFNSGNETTQSVVKARHSQFMLSYYEILRNSNGTQETMAALCSALGSHFDASSVCLCTLERGVPMAEAEAEAAWPDMPDATSSTPLCELAEVIDSLSRGAVARYDNTADVTEPALKAAFEKQGAKAFLAVPWSEERAVTNVLTIGLCEPRRWNDEDVSTVEKVLERTLGAVEREKALQRERIMAGEIDHRARNLLAVVSALARTNDAQDVASYRAKLLDRLMALSQTHTLLAGDRWSGLSLRRLLHELLAPYNYGEASRVSLEGPPLLLQPEMAQYLGMVVHELATNAAKHGALHEKQGAVRISWHLGQDNTLHILWRESAISPEVADPSFTGFGSVLARRVVTQQLGGTIHKTFETGQLTVEIALPFGPVENRFTNRVDEAPLAVKVPGDLRVLVVEDDPIIALDLSAALTELGYQVVSSARSVQSAIASIRESSPQLVVLDLNLAGETSEPVGEMLVERGIPFLQLTGYERDVAPNSVFADRPRIIKPYSMSDLRRELAELSATITAD